MTPSLPTVHAAANLPKRHENLFASRACPFRTSFECDYFCDPPSGAFLCRKGGCPHAKLSESAPEPCQMPQDLGERVLEFLEF